MTKKTRGPAPAWAGDARVYYAPDVLGRMQSLLAALADLDLAYDSDLETVQGSNTPDVIKQAVIQTLEQQHHHRRALLERRLEALQHRAMFRD